MKLVTKKISSAKHNWCLQLQKAVKGGTLSGSQQNMGTFVFMAQGSDYLGKVVFKKGTVVLLR